ncbi:MAG TPA: acyl-CoA dehydrogenase family protein [Pseudonocardia sp.]
MARAEKLVPLLRENAARADAERRLPDDVVSALIEAGIFRAWTPRRYGGFELDPVAHFEMTTHLSRGCSSTGWTVAMMTTTTWMACALPDQGQDEIFGADPEARFVGLFTPSAEPARRVDGGFLISGTKPFATGCMHATWAEVPVPVLGADGELENVYWMFFPMSEARIEDSWYCMGMRGTGSHTVHFTDVFIPEYRTVPMMGPNGAMGGYTRNEHPDELLYRALIGMVARECFVGSVLGIAKYALELVLKTLPKRSIQYGPYTKQSAAVSTQLQVAEAATMIDTAEMHARRAAEDTWKVAQSGAYPVDPMVRIRCGHDSTFAIRTCKEAVDRLMYLSGASGVAQGNPLERLFRDVATGTLHGVARLDATSELLGSALCGEEPTGSFIF